MYAQDIAAAIRGGLMQQNRLLKLDTPLEGNALVVQRAVGRSRVGRHYTFTLDVLSLNSDIELKKLIAQPVTLWIQQANGTYRPVHGYVYTARRLGADGGLTTYQLTMQAWMHVLRFRRDQRIWIDKTAEEIVSDVLNAHPEARGRFRFELAHPLPGRSYTRQSETDWNFVHRLLESEGLFCHWEQADDGQSHTLVVTDRIGAFPKLSPETVAFHRAGTQAEADAFTQWSGSRTLQSVSLTTRTFDYKNPAATSNPKGTTIPTVANQGELPDQLEVYEYTGPYTYLDQQRGDQLSKLRMEEWESRAKRFHGVGGVRAIDAGRRFTLGGHPVHERDAHGEREFAAVEVAWWIENNLPATPAPNFPHSLQQELADARARKAGDAAFQVPHADGSVGFYIVEVEAQRTSVPYRSPFEHDKPEMHLETAIVVGPKGEEVYTDELNRIRVMFIWDRVNPGDQRASCWVRVAQSDTGAGYGGVHIPRVGEEVVIAHVGGDCDRPLAIARVYNGANKPQWHSDGIVSGFRSKEYAGSGYNQLVMDDATRQNRVHLYSTSYASHLHLGYLVQHTDNTRGAFLGAGFDLKSDAYGAVRAARGMYISTHPASAGQPLAANPANEQLVSSEGLFESLSQASATAKGESLQAGQDALRAFNDATRHNLPGDTGSGGRTGGGGTGSANGFAEPAMLLASPAGVGVSTQKSAFVTADRQVNLVSGENTHVVAGKSLLASVAEKISVFAQNAGMKLFAGKGKVEIQAQGDALDLTALQDLKITSVDGKVVLTAAKEIWLGAGGSYIRITADKIENGTSGQILERCASWDKQGPTSVQQQRQSFFESQAERQFSQQLSLDETLHAFADKATAVKYHFLDETGMLIGGGLLDEAGKTMRAFTEVPQEIKAVVDLREGRWTALSYQDPFDFTDDMLDEQHAAIFDYDDHDAHADADEHDDFKDDTRDI
ncbi:type VI secretion system Vgr family protein [Burkholderia stagnalis]|uniref:type VI secretion system Vgr family protein n=1 Tax=Burkholderia stagnalis TaxID=1503054 RepID=UPI0007557728|nr:type VI secretion system Vgr family protein [Burkholderia stagnalis]KWI33194.1 type VI secretion protein [Burkholderia stagnalis]KWI64479.1 type VI secretion protein [Burkholderia stagnalis]